VPSKGSREVDNEKIVKCDSKRFLLTLQVCIHRQKNGLLGIEVVRMEGEQKDCGKRIGGSWVIYRPEAASWGHKSGRKWLSVACPN
jgi:hypothetical protein